MIVWYYLVGLGIRVGAHPVYADDCMTGLELDISTHKKKPQPGTFTNYSFYIIPLENLIHKGKEYILYKNERKKKLQKN